jgi:hypothetical protein
MSIRLFYDHWHIYNQAFIETSVLQRMLSHEANHAGELSQTLGIAGLPQIDLGKPGT